MSDLEREENNNNQKIIASFAVILAVVVIAVGVTYFTNKKDSSIAGTAAAPTTNATSDASSSGGTAGSYKDGSYTSSGSYQTPGGQESIGVTVTLKDGVVTDTSLKQSANNSDTKEYQGQFASGYKSQVVGKALSDISLSRVSGSSLTSDGFNKALDQIKNQAQV